MAKILEKAAGTNAFWLLIGGAGVAALLYSAIKGTSISETAKTVSNKAGQLFNRVFNPVTEVVGATIGGDKTANSANIHSSLGGILGTSKTPWISFDQATGHWTFIGGNESNLIDTIEGLGKLGYNVVFDTDSAGNIFLSSAQYVPTASDFESSWEK